MSGQVPRYPSYKPDVEPYYEEAPQTSHPVAPYQAGPSARSNYAERSIPQFLSDRDDEPESSEYLQSLLSKPASYYTSRILAGALGGVAIAFLAALISSNSARDVIAGAKASTTPVLSVASATMPPNSVERSTPPNAADMQLKESAQTLAPENPAPGAATVTVAAVTPTGEDIKTAYQGAVQGGDAKTVAIPPEATVATDAIRHLDASEIASLLKRADNLIANGDVAAARLVLRRAAEAGEGRAAMMLGGTYDPKVLERLGVHGVVPDLNLARSWYEKAKRFGASEATPQLESLAKKQD